jgi:hypothetical protein
MPQLPHTPRVPLAELSPNTRSRVVAARDYGNRFSGIGRKENLNPVTCRSIFKNAPNQASCKTNPCSGRPLKLNPRDHRRIFRVIAQDPKITAAQLHVECNLGISKKTIYRFLKKSGIQK